MGADMIALAERVEAAIGPDREIDFAILCLVDPRAIKTGPLPGDPKLTSSLDAAMSLADDADLAQLINDAAEATGQLGWREGQWRQQFILNFVAAALRARAAQDPK